MSTGTNYSLIKPSKIKEIVKGAKYVAVDTETTGLSPFKDKLCYMSLSVKAGEAFLVDIQNYSTEVAEFLESDIPKVFHKALFDELFFRTHGYKVNNVAFDTKIAAYVLDPLSRFKIGLKDLAKSILGKEEVITFENLFPKPPRRKKNDPPRVEPTILDVPQDKLVEYACADADHTVQLFSVFAKRIKEEGCQVPFKLDMEVNEVITEMMYNGCKIDAALLEEQRQKCLVLKNEAEKKCRELLEDNEINLGSTVQLVKKFYEDLELPVRCTTEKGLPSAGSPALRLIADLHPSIPHLLEWTEYSDLLSKYLEPIPPMLDTNNMLHGWFNQVNTDTGRLSSSGPNLQNMPSRSEIGRQVRLAWVSRFKNGGILSLDYSQIEMRIMAHLSGDELLIKQIKDGLDLHTVTAMMIYGISDPEKVTKNQRGFAKTINFGVIYGMGASKLAVDTGVEEEEAAKYLETYFEKYNGVSTYKKDSFAFAKEQGFVETIIGRKLYFREGTYLGTRAVNFPIQGSAAEVIKMAMVAVYREMKKMKCKSKLILNVHDELDIDGPMSELKDIQPMATEIMENIVKLSVPLKVDSSIATSWGACK